MLQESGLHVLWAALLFLIILALLSGLAIQYPAYAPYYFAYAAFSALQAIAGVSRVEFLELQFGRRTSRQIRFIENLAITSPWLYLAIFMGNLYLGSFLLLCVVAMSLFSRRNSSRSLPTPFTKSPFEIPLFFRRVLVYVLAIALFVTGIACYVGNFNLGLVCLASVLLISCSAQEYREPNFFVWVYALNPGAFLRMKVGRNMLQLLALTSPLTLMLIAAFPQHFLIVLLCLVTGLLLNAIYVLLKYAVYPRTFAVPDIIVLIIGFLFPLILPFIVYRYYRKAHSNLSAWL